MKNYVSINFIYIRERNYLNRKEFAIKHGVSYGALSSYEQGVSLPSIDFVREVCAEYKVLIDDFVNKDLSKIGTTKPNVDQVNEIGKNSILSDDSIKLYEKLIAEKDKTLSAKDQLLETKDVVIEKTEKIVETLEKHNNVLEILLNQNGKL